MPTFMRLTVCFFVLCLSACGPRGETNSLGQVYESSKQRFVTVKDAAVPGDVAQPLKDIDSHLSQISTQEGAQASQTASQIVTLLAPLTTRAGYLSRPAMGEIVTQYRLMSESGAGVENPSAKLLAARTYALLASELETTKFAVQ